MKKFAPLLVLLIVALGTVQCRSQNKPLQKVASDKNGIIPGADQVEKYLPYLKGKRVAMVANQTSIIGNKSSVDSLKSLGINIVKVFGPEHGFRGNASNGARVD
ncbi:MAG TPA: exo-beta-N-acetylmuramidase NamZ domain-containing protein, partial [Sphingobacteriaceae bacterium]